MYVFCIYKKYTSAAAYMIRVTYTFCIVCIYYVFTKSIHIQRSFQLDSCIRIGFFKKHIFQVSSVFTLSPNFVQVLYSFYVFCIYVGIWCTCFGHLLSWLVQSLYIAIQNIYKFGVMYNFYIHFVYFFDKGVPKCHGFH